MAKTFPPRPRPEPEPLAVPGPRPLPVTRGEPIVLDLGGGIFDLARSSGNILKAVEHIHGRAWSHVGEDAEGRWVYRLL